MMVSLYIGQRVFSSVPYISQQVLSGVPHNRQQVFWSPFTLANGYFIVSLYNGEMVYSGVPYINQQVLSDVPYNGQQVFWSPFTLANGYFMVSFDNSQKVFSSVLTLTNRYFLMSLTLANKYSGITLHWPTGISWCPFTIPKSYFPVSLTLANRYVCTIQYILVSLYTLANGYFLVYFVQKLPIFLANYLNLLTCMGGNELRIFCFVYAVFRWKLVENVLYAFGPDQFCNTKMIAYIIVKSGGCKKYKSWRNILLNLPCIICLNINSQTFGHFQLIK
jgi:hypothetical protein